MFDWGFRCFHCHRSLAISSHGFCSKCYALLSHSAYCGHCGSNLLENQLSCGNCLRNEPKWHRIVQVSAYKAPLSEWIHRFKFQQQHYLDNALGRLLLLAIKQAQREHQLVLPEVIIPVPLFWQRHWHRSYNQAELLARYVAKKLNLPLDLQSLQRVKPTRSQRELTAMERRKNLKNAFCFKPLKNYQRVAIVDDVVTTGSTLNTICLELRKQGVKEIQVWTLARA